MTKKADETRFQEAQVLAYLKDKAQDILGVNQRFVNKKVTLQAAQNNLFQSQIEDKLEKIFKDKIAVPQYKAKDRRTPTERILNGIWSDLHFGSDLDPREVPTKYGIVEESRRMAFIVQTLAEWKLQYRDETQLFIHLIGDIIQNHLYDPRDGAPLAEQFSRAVHILTQAVVYLCGRFKKVTVFCTPGNHGRNTARHKDRAVNQKWDSLENMIYFSIKTALMTAKIPNVEVIIPLMPFYTWDAFGMSGFGTHGDTVVTPGYPNKSIDTEKVRRQVNEINGKLAPDKRHRLFICGHVHVDSETKLPNGVIFMTNSCLLPPDAYAVSIGITHNACSQKIWESVPGHIVGHKLTVDVDEHTDKDKSLDKIIKPFFGF